MTSEVVLLRKTFTYQNYIQYTCTKTGLRTRTQLSIRPPQRTFKSPLIEAVEAAKSISISAGGCVDLIVDRSYKDLCLFEAFAAAEVPFRVHEFMEAADSESPWQNLCDSHGIDLISHEFGASEYEKIDALISEQYQVVYPRQIRLLAVLKKVNGFPVLSGSLPQLKRLNGKWMYSFPSQDHLFFLHEFFEQGHEFGVPSFFIWSPELFYSFAKLPILQNTLHLNEELPAHLEKFMFSQGGFSLHESEGFNTDENVDSSFQEPIIKPQTSRRNFLRIASQAAMMLTAAPAFAIRSVSKEDLQVDLSALSVPTSYTDVILIAADKDTK